MIHLTCTPEGEIAIDGVAESALEKRILQVGGQGVGELLVCLATEALAVPLEPGLVWLRDFARVFFGRLCQTKDPVAVHATDGEMAAHAVRIPMIPGAEYVRTAVLAAAWSAMASRIAGLAGDHDGGLSAWLHAANPAWHLVGRVTFHLAENKTDSRRPFAFLATYSEKLGDKGTPQHLPLARALQQMTAAADRKALENLLEPVRAAAIRSTLLRDWLTTKRLFQAMALSAPEAYEVLREVAVFQDCGIIVKLPDWWRGGRPSRPTVAVTIDAPKSVNMNARALLGFRVQVSLDGEPLTPDELAMLAKADAGLISLRGKWVEVDGGKLQQAMAHWRKVADAHAESGVNFHDAMRLLAGFRDDRGLLAEADSMGEGDAGWTEIIAGKNLREMLDRLGDPPEARAPVDLRATLRPYQLRGFAWLSSMADMGFGACLADDMGLGKTLQVLALLLARKGKPGVAMAPALIVVPASLLGNWKAECGRFAPSLRVFFAHPSLATRDELAAATKDPAAFLQGHDAMITTYQYVQRAPAWQEFGWGLAVIDEAQAIKNPGAAVTRAIKALRAGARVAMTGTPVENRPGDLWSLFDFLNPGLLGSATAFAHAVKSCAERPQGFTPIRKLVQPYILRRMKTDRSIISDLPDKTEIKAWCGLTKRQAKLYARLVEELARLLDDPEVEGIKRRGLVLSFLMKFKQVCNHPSHWNGDGMWSPGDSGKFLRLGEIAEELAERRERVLVFTQFQEMCDPLAAHLAGVFGRPGLVLHGGTPVKRRAAMVEDFQCPGGPPFFVLSVKAGGTGLNLTAASHVVHFDRWWNPAVENQATDRAFRIGQKKNVFVHKFICRGTMEERIDALISEKSVLANHLIGSGASGESLLTEMSRDELLSFVSLDINSAVG